MTNILTMEVYNDKYPDQTLAYSVSLYNPGTVSRHGISPNLLYPHINDHFCYREYHSSKSVIFNPFINIDDQHCMRSKVVNI